MKSFALVSVLCLAVLLALVAPSLGQAPKYCWAPDIPREGSCADVSTADCSIIVLGRFSARQMPRRIRCVDVGRNKSKCTSEIVCGIPPAS